VIFRGKRLSLPEIFWYDSNENSKLTNLKTQQPIAFQRKLKNLKTQKLKNLFHE